MNVSTIISMREENILYLANLLDDDTNIPLLLKHYIEKRNAFYFNSIYEILLWSLFHKSEEELYDIFDMLFKDFFVFDMFVDNISSYNALKDSYENELLKVKVQDYFKKKNVADILFKKYDEVVTTNYFFTFLDSRIQFIEETRIGYNTLTSNIIKKIKKLFNPKRLILTRNFLDDTDYITYAIFTKGKYKTLASVIYGICNERVKRIREKDESQIKALSKIICRYPKVLSSSSIHKKIYGG